MTSLPEFQFYSQDEDLVRRVSAYAEPIGPIEAITAAKDLVKKIAPDTVRVLLIDMCAPDASMLVANLHVHSPGVLVIALGVPRSDPLLFAEQHGVHAAIDAQMERKDFQGVLRRALDFRILQEENARLRDELARAPSVMHISQAMRLLQKPDSMRNLTHFTRAFRNSKNVSVLMEDIVEGVASSLSVGRVGLFAKCRASEHYCFRAGVKCLEATDSLEFETESPLAILLEGSSSVICAEALQSITKPDARRVLRRSLEVLGADVILPLQLQGRLLGWLFLGQRISGQSFGPDDYENLMTVGELAATVLENAVQCEELSVQRNLLNSLLDSITFGLVAVSDDEVIRCVNQPALALLERRSSDVLNRPVDVLGSLSDPLRRALSNEDLPVPVSWRPPGGGQEHSVYVQRLESNNLCLGAFALIQGVDAKVVPLGAPKGGELSQAAPGLALSPDLSHEIKNQLVAISTFVQLLPERYEDAEFREQFCEIAAQEIDRITDLLSHAPDEALINN